MAPSSRIARADIEAAKAFLEEKGFKVFIHPQTYKHADGKTQQAGTVKEKISALHDLAQDDKIKAVYFATGGQRALTLLDHINYDLIAENPKIYMGFSDHTALLNAITAKAKLVTWHSPTFKRLLKNPQVDYNFSILMGQEKEIPLVGATIVKSGKAEGRLFGGNMAVFHALLEKDIIDPKDNILFLEEIGEELTTFDRELCTLKRRGVLKKISALIFGQFTDMKDTGTPFGLTFEEIVKEHTRGLKIPILMNAPFGHGADLYAFPIGAAVTLEENVLNII